MSKTAFLFTGQGAQFVGMGKDLYKKYSAFKDIFDEAGEHLKINLSEICGDITELSKTQNAQSAIFVVSYGIYKLLRENNIKPDCAAGFSLGEITALAASGMLSFTNALDLIKIRGEAMRLACEHTPGAMYSIIGADNAEIEKICAEVSVSHGYVIPANYNCPGQIVISGELNAVEAAVKIFSELKHRTVKLNVMGAFHTKLMRHRQDMLDDFLRTLDFNPPEFDLYSNLSGKKFTIDGGHHEWRTYMIDHIPEQMSNPVRFCEELENLEDDGCDTFIEIGAGKVLSGFVKRTCKNKDAGIINAQDVETLEKTIEVLL